MERTFDEVLQHSRNKKERKIGAGGGGGGGALGVVYWVLPITHNDW